MFKLYNHNYDDRLEQMMSEMSMSWGEIANLTHATQVEAFGFCMCEDNEGKENPYTDCPTTDLRQMFEEEKVEGLLLKKDRQEMK
jgi:hypothetical protein